MFGTPELDAFKPDVIYIHTTWRNIEQFPTTGGHCGSRAGDAAGGVWPF